MSEIKSCLLSCYLLFCYFSAVTCPLLDIPDNEGLRHTVQSDSVIFSCAVGMVLDGHNEMECLVNGSWVGYIPTCYSPGKIKYY